MISVSYLSVYHLSSKTYSPLFFCLEIEDST